MAPRTDASTTSRASTPSSSASAATASTAPTNTPTPPPSPPTTGHSPNSSTTRPTSKEGAARAREDLGLTDANKAIESPPTATGQRRRYARRVADMGGPTVCDAWLSAQPNGSFCALVAGTVPEKIRAPIRYRGTLPACSSGRVEPGLPEVEELRLT